MKKLLALIIILGLFTAVVAGCGGTDEDAASSSDSAPTKLVVGATAKPHA